MIACILAEGLEDLTMKSNYSGRAFEEQATRTRQASLEQQTQALELFPALSIANIICLEEPVFPEFLPTWPQV